MNREKLISREYKLVLKTENFTGNESDLTEKASIFWANYTKIINPIIKTFNGDLTTISIKREIRFYDTKDFILNNNSYIFRQRKSLLDDKKEVTLKFRHPDRYISQDRNMKTQKDGKEEIKFEEDIKAKFISLYSFSASQGITDKKEFKKIKHIANLYPGLKQEFDKNGESENLILVNNLVIQEMVITGANIIICDDPLVSAECALIIWYDTEAFTSNPIIAEFSFRYGNKKEKFSRETAQKTYDLFLLIQEGMKLWIDSDNATKTGFVYGDR